MTIDGLDTPRPARLAPLCKPNHRDTVMDRYREVARALPDSVAVVTDSGDITYDRLLHRAYSVARRISSVVGFDHGPIAVDVDSTLDTIVTMLAVIASGHSLVPLDAGLPADRRRQIVEQSGATHLTPSALDDAPDSARPLPTVTGEHAAIIAYTSGSTGAAKGVVLGHRMCLAKAYEVASAMGLGPRDRVGNALPVSFGAGINTLFAGLLSGSRVYCRDPRTSEPDGLVRWMQDHALTTMHCSPSLLRTLSSSRVPGSVPSLRLVATYGETLQGRDVRAFRRELSSSATIFNWYATTEAGGVSFGRFGPERELPDGALPAGTPISTKIVAVVRADDTECAPGETGEIRVTSACLADGYLGLPQLTAERFESLRDGIRVYRTGDLGRYDSDGQLHLLGRADDAVKVRGYLVEPVEVEGALRALSDVSDAAVFGSAASGDAELIAVVAAPTRTEADIRAALRTSLPDWMVPRRILVLDVIPRNERGKVRRAEVLDAIRSVKTANGGDISGATEMWLAVIVCTTLDLTALGPDDDYTALGGTSLDTMRVLVGIRNAFNVELTAQQLITATTVRTLATLIDRDLAESDRKNLRSTVDPVLVPLIPEGTSTPLYIVAGAGVPAIGLLALARRLQSDRPVFALQANGLESRRFPDWTVRRAARRYVREIRKVQPQGPYLLAGQSLGAWIALEMAHILEADGDTVQHVVLLDPRLFRWILDKLPGGKDLPSAPPDQHAQVEGARPSLVSMSTLAYRIVTAGVVRHATTERWLTFGIIGWFALKRHRPRPWSGPTTVVRTPSNTSDPRSWAALATGELHLTDVPGLHLEMVREPMAATVAAIIDTAVSR